MPENNPSENSWNHQAPQLDSLIEESRRDSAPLLAFINDHCSDHAWCEHAIDHLIGICQDGLDSLTGFRIMCLAMICDRQRAIHTERIVKFVESKLSFIAKAGEREPTLWKQQEEHVRSCVHMLFYLLSATRSNEAKTLLREMERDNAANEFGTLASQQLKLLSETTLS